MRLGGITPLQAEQNTQPHTTVSRAKHIGYINLPPGSRRSDDGRRLATVPAGTSDSARGGEGRMIRAHVYWFFRRKAKIVLLTALTYAALC